MGTPPEESPSAAFGLALAGGIIVILAGLVVAALGAAVTFFLAGIGGIFGLIGVFWGIMIIIFANLLRSRPEQHAGYGAAIIVFALLSWFGSFGGFAIGFILALIGGILAILWKPGGVSVNVTMASGTFQSEGSFAQASVSTKFCPSCGAPVEAGATFCRNCGKSL
jgi:hypothetical protein